MRVFVAAHKPVEDIPHDYELLEVGAANRKHHFSQVLDSTGDNISRLNESYCEITGLYWIWKNVDSDIVGLVHYRRYFMDNWWASGSKHILTFPQINNILSRADVVVPSSYWFKTNAKDMYANNHYGKDLDYARTVINERSPEYLHSFDCVMRQKHLHLCNMVITHKEILDTYMKWLMPILEDCNKAIDTSEYSPYDKRLIGYLAEWLFNVWLDYNRSLKVATVPIAKTDDTFMKARAKEVWKICRYPYRQLSRKID